MNNVVNDLIAMGNLSQYDFGLFNAMVAKMQYQVLGLPNGAQSPDWLIFRAIDNCCSKDIDDLRMVAHVVFKSYTLFTPVPNQVDFHMLGLIYQHKMTRRHCTMYGKGMDPRNVDLSLPVRAYEFSG